MRVFRARELKRFLRAVDSCLEGPVRMILLGGSAIALGYGVDAGTGDIDTWQTDYSRLDTAIASARARTDLPIPVSQAAVGDAPYHYEDRLRRVLPRLARLQVFVLEKHDLALSKAVRGYENDLAAIEALHRAWRLDRDTLVRRYLEEMGHAIGDRRRLDGNLVLVVERLYGEVEADRVGDVLRRRRRR